MNTEPGPDHWDEETSQRYLDYGRYFVPAREQQMRIMVDLLRGLLQPCIVLELCCGEGLLAEMLLAELPGATYLGLDGSDLMLEQASQRLSRFGSRVKLGKFELADRSWRRRRASGEWRGVFTCHPPPGWSWKANLVQGCLCHAG